MLFDGVAGAVRSVGHCILKWKDDPLKGSKAADRPFRCATLCGRMSALKLKLTTGVYDSSHCLGVIMYRSVLGTQIMHFSHTYAFRRPS
jgi:hypothetical protein